MRDQFAVTSRDLNRTALRIDRHLRWRLRHQFNEQLVMVFLHQGSDGDRQIFTASGPALDVTFPPIPISVAIRCPTAALAATTTGQKGSGRIVCHVQYFRGGRRPCECGKTVAALTNEPMLTGGLAHKNDAGFFALLANYIALRGDTQR